MILQMKKVTVFALRSDRDAVLKELQRKAVMMIDQNDGAAPDGRLDAAQKQLTEAEEAISFLAPYSTEKGGLLAALPELSLEELAKAGGQAEISERANRISAGIAAAEADVAAKSALVKQAEPWEGCPFSKKEFEGTPSCGVLSGYLPSYSFEELKQGIEELPAWIEMYGSQNSSAAAVIVYHRAYEAEVEERLKDFGFMPYRPSTGEEVPAQYIAKLRAGIDASRAEAAELTEQAKQLGAESANLKRLYDSIAADRDRLAVPYASTQKTFYISGWVTEERQAEIEQAVSAATDIYEIEITDPAEGEQPPTLVRNAKLVTPFETFTDMFSRPNPLEGIDPNPVMAPWYWVIFGMMMADAGYGLLMAILFYLFLKLKKPRGEAGKLVKVMLYASITTAFWGVMFGSYFGAAWFKPVLFTPLENPIPLLVMSFVIGILHIFCGLIVNAIELIKQGRVGEAIGHDFGWIVMITGLPMLVVLPAAGKWVTFAGLAMIILFTKSGERNPIKRVFGGVSSLYGITGYMSDILSYSRIVALMLASGVVAMVMNILAGMVAGMMPVVGFLLSLLVYGAGHAFNLVMGLLSAYVHTSRLQYIEFYSKFYEGGGYEFTPLGYNTKYSVLTNY